MRRFATLYQELHTSTKANDKVRSLVNYLKDASDNDRLWMIALFTDRKPKRAVQIKYLRSWWAEVSDLPEWLFEESYKVAGDMVESISLTLPAPKEESSLSLSDWILQMVDQKSNTEEEQKAFVLSAWACLSADERYIFNKLFTGGFKVNISQKQVVKAISSVIKEEENKIAHMLMSNWSPLTTTYQELLSNVDWNSNASKLFPFYHCHQIDTATEELGDAKNWQAEWKWEGIRSQLLKRNAELFIWSSDEELLTNKYPEFQPLESLNCDDFVIDGVIVVFKNGEIRPFNELQKKSGRKTVGKKLLKDYPCVIIAYDLLEQEGEDIRDLPLTERQTRLEKLVSELSESYGDLIFLSQPIEFSSWQELSKIRNNARVKKAEGLMLKLKSGKYKSERHKGEWWKWKVDPYTINAVMLYAQKKQGSRTNQFSEFTFAVWANDDTLVPFTKAREGLTDKEIKEISTFVKKNTKERFGPVRSLKPELVFEIEFEGINESNRHKCGVVLKSPKIKNWHKDKSVKEAHELKDLIRLIE